MTVPRSRKARRQPPSLIPSELSNPFRAAQNGGVVRESIQIVPGKAATVKRDRAACECWLDRYAASGKIDAAQFEAGLRFRMDWLTAVLGIPCRDSTRLSKTAGLSLEERLSRLVGAERDLKEAFRVLSMQQKVVITSVCGCDQAAGNAARIRTLRRGLDALARLWNL